MSPATEKTFHGLKLLCSCGGGAYGEVWYCEDLSGQRMAVKIVSKTRLGDAWKRELQGVINYRRITESSPYLLRIFHVAEDEECFYYTMEAADSAEKDEYAPDTLARRLNSGPLPPDQLFPVLAGVFNGLVAIHQAGFAHRDIKPDNIIFVGGVPKLSDIGLVSSLSNSMTRLAGTLEFLPPEERGGDTESTDRVSRQRNDLYAFGKVVYCAATGMEPGQYPSLPTLLKPTMEQKLFLHLSFKLCARESKLRTGDLKQLYTEFKRIERQLETGETAADKIRYFLGKMSQSVLSGLLALGRMCRKFWWLLILLLCFGVGAGYLLFRPGKPPVEPPARGNAASENETPPPVQPEPSPTQTKPAKKSAAAKPKTKEYFVPSLDLKMRIPGSWQAMSEEHIRALADEMTKELNTTTKGEDAKKMLRRAIAEAKNWKGLIRCDLYDVIELSRLELPSTANELWTMPEEKLRREIMAQLGVFKTPNVKIYELKRIMTAERRCLVIDFAIDRSERVIKYIFLEPPRHAVVVALTADAANFPRRKNEFDAVMRTLEFTVPPPKYETPKPPAPAKPTVKPPPKPPEKPHPDDPDTRLYVNRRHGFSMRVPLNWERLTRKYIEDLIRDQRAVLKRGGKPAIMAKVKLDHFDSILNHGGAAFHCDIDADFSDCVEIVPDDTDKAELWKLSEEELRGIFQLEAQRSSMPVAIYSIKRSRIAGRDALIVESSSDTNRVHSLDCIVFITDKKIIHFAVSAKYANFAKRKKEFDAAMKTLKFEK